MDGCANVSASSNRLSLVDAIDSMASGHLTATNQLTGCHHFLQLYANTPVSMGVSVWHRTRALAEGVIMAIDVKQVGSETGHA